MYATDRKLGQSNLECHMLNGSSDKEVSPMVVTAYYSIINPTKSSCPVLSSIVMQEIISYKPEVALELLRKINASLVSIMCVGTFVVGARSVLLSQGCFWTTCISLVMVYMTRRGIEKYLIQFKSLWGSCREINGSSWSTSIGPARSVWACKGMAA